MTNAVVSSETGAIYLVVSPSRVVLKNTTDSSSYDNCSQGQETDHAGSRGVG